MSDRDWLQELCPEISEWQVELIADHIQKARAQGAELERGACAGVIRAVALHGDPSQDYEEGFWTGLDQCEAAILARGDPPPVMHSIEIDIPDQELLELMKLAHELDITFNQFVCRALVEMIEQVKKPKPNE